MGRYFRGNVFSESSKQEITIDKAMSIVQFNYRIDVELVPKTVIPKGAPLKRETPGGKPENLAVRIKRVGKERKGKKRSLSHPYQKSNSIGLRVNKNSRLSTNTVIIRRGGPRPKF